MAKKFVYDIKWEEADGDNGYYGRLSPAEAKKISAFLKKVEAAGHIKDIRIEIIEGYNFKALMEEIKALLED